jgi:hypothetical protein
VRAEVLQCVDGSSISQKAVSFFLLTYHMKIKRRWLFPWNKTLKPHKRLDESKTMHKVAEEHDVGYVTVGNWKKK